MRTSCLSGRPLAAAAAALLVAGCQQPDRPNPFEPEVGARAVVTIGPDGGTVSLPPGVSLEFPAGALSGPVSIGVSELANKPFPSVAGKPLPGTAFRVEVPAGTHLTQPARVALTVDPASVGEDEDVRLALGVRREDGSVPVFTGTYDAATGLLRAEISEVGDLAAVVVYDAVPVVFGAAPAFSGGPLPTPDAPDVVGPTVSVRDGVSFSASCGPASRSCRTAGILQVWADEVVQERLGHRLALVNPAVEGTIDFISFDEHGVPLEVSASLTFGGELRARLRKGVMGHRLDAGLRTSTWNEAEPTGLLVEGNELVIETMTRWDGEQLTGERVAFEVAQIGTSASLKLRFELPIRFTDIDGGETEGTIVAHVRLRR